ncbi:haloacid dehalogenase-like hydrolase [Diaporthe helianthi]|uniref:Haloacid dehalogenase-like hydrolase n=1 Tax=Diaporthe helianthi TaxID=158607 RepID=A0A2P5HHB4_DIAHE|nr:haloacid dehalogenase-like hydrolase [Diaporthe helianthi]
MSPVPTSETITCRGLLLDLDGTLVDSTVAVGRFWNSIAKELDTDPKLILETCHGRRTIDTLRMLCPEKASWEYVREIEGRIPTIHGEGAAVINGAQAFLGGIIESEAPWAIVTSGSKPLAQGWLNKLGLPHPSQLITAESVENGKPDPACYILGLQAIGASEANDVIVLEDSPTGILAAKAAGCQVIGLVTSHTLEQVWNAKPDWVVRDLASIHILGCTDGNIRLHITELLLV